MLAPKKRKTRKTKAQQIKDLVRKAQKAGLKPDEIASRLGVSIRRISPQQTQRPAILAGRFSEKVPVKACA